MIGAVENGGKWWSISGGCVVRCNEEPAIREADTANAQHLVTRPSRQYEQVTQRVRTAHNAFTFPLFFFGPALVFGVRL